MPVAISALPFRDRFVAKALILITDDSNSEEEKIFREASSESSLVFYVRLRIRCAVACMQ